MKHTAFRILACAVFAALVPVGFAAKATNPPAAAKKKPAFVVDASPLSADPKGAVVTSYADIVEPAQKAVVSVHSTKIVRQRMNPLLRQFFGDQQLPDQELRQPGGLGSGVIVTPDGYILTNNHVIEGADELNVSLPDGRELKAIVVGTDPKTDVAVIKIDAEKLPTLVLADSDKLRVGDVVFAVGNPLGVGQTVTMGIVSAKGRSLGLLEGVAGYEDFIQTDAAINMGNSGGALIDAKGRLVGINSAIVTNTRGNIGIGLAIPVNLAASIVNSLIETGTVARGYLGIEVEPINADTAEALGLKKDIKAVVINNVVPGSPAESAGLHRADAVLAINERPVTSRDDLRLLISQLPPNTEVRIAVLRDGKPRTLTAKLGQLEESTARNELLPGVEAAPLTPEIRRVLGLDRRMEGLAITNVSPDSPYADRLAPAMVVLEINREPVNDVATARKLIQPERNLFLVHIRGVYRYLTVVVKK